MTGDIYQAQKHFQAVLEMKAPEELRGLARDGLLKIARKLKASEPRMDGSLLSGWAMWLLRGRQLEAGPGDRLRDWDAVAARARRERLQGDICTAGIVGKGLLSAGAWTRIYAIKPAKQPASDVNAISLKLAFRDRIIKSNILASFFSHTLVFNAMTLPNLYFLAFELLVLVLFLICLQNAWKRGSWVVWQLLAGVFFGLLLEWATIQQLDAYQYGHFLIMLGTVPVVIGVAWGTIIYSVRAFSDSINLPEWARPALDGLLALSIDLSMNAIAIRLGMWDWGHGLDYQYFGVPCNNFWAWFWVVFSFSFSHRLLSKLPGFWGRWLSPAGAIICGTAGVLITNRLITGISNELAHYSVIIAVLGGALLLVLVLRPNRISLFQDAFIFTVPLGFHAYFLTAGLISSVILQPPFLLMVSMIMIMIALGLHREAIKCWYRSKWIMRH